MGRYVNTFAQGLDRDSSKNKYDTTHYYDAQNVRVLTQNGLSSGAIENLLGNYRRVSTVQSGNNYICGHVVLRDNIILWTSTNNSSSPLSARCPLLTPPLSVISPPPEVMAIAPSEDIYTAALLLPRKIPDSFSQLPLHH